MQTLDLSKLSRAESKLRLLLYGEAGSGKTSFLKDLPRPLLVMDWDGKYDPLLGQSGIEVVSYYSAEAGDAVKLIPKFWKDWMEAKKDPKWASIAVDSLTALDRSLERYVVMNSGKGKGASDRATIQEYGDMKLWYKTWLNSLCSCSDKHVVVLAHEEFNKDSESEVISIRPKITGRIAEDIASIFRDTWFLEIKTLSTGNQRVLHYQKYKKYICASVTLAGKGSIEDPTWDKIQKERAK